MIKKKFHKKSIDIVFIIQRLDILGNKDIDHYLPFLYFLTKNKQFNYTARGLVFDSKKNFLKKIDPKIRLLLSLKNVDLEFLEEGYFFNLIKQFKLKIIKNNFIFTKFLNKFLFKMETILSKNIKLNNKLGNNFINSKRPIIITLLSKKSLNIISDIKRFNKRAKSIELTHGTDVCDNKMVLESNLDKKEIIKNEKVYDKIDYFIKTSKRELKDAVSQGMNKKKGIAIGSPRYSREWFKIKSNLKLDGSKVVLNKKYKIKVLFVMPKQNINIFWEELIRTIDFVSSYQKFELVLLNYNKYFPKIPNEIINRINIRYYLISEKYSTSKLIDWADIIFHAGTGIVFEFFMKEKITVLPRYLTCNTLISDKYNAGYNLNNRDELRDFCNKASTSLKDLKKNYKKECRQNNKKFINDFVYVNSKSISRNIDKALENIYNLF
jgi:hypothetical protein